MALLEEYKAHTTERATLGVTPLALTADQVAQLVELLKASPIAEADYAMELFTDKVPAGVDDAAYVKAAFLNDILEGKASCASINKTQACEILGSMLGGFNVQPLVNASDAGDKSSVFVSPGILYTVTVISLAISGLL